MRVLSREGSGAAIRPPVVAHTGGGPRAVAGCALTGWDAGATGVVQATGTGSGRGRRTGTAPGGTDEADPGQEAAQQGWGAGGAGSLRSGACTPQSKPGAEAPGTIPASRAWSTSPYRASTPTAALRRHPRCCCRAVTMMLL